MTEEFTRLRNLRISVARVAQAAGVSLAPIGVPDNASYEVLHRKAEEMYPGCGWNTLCAAVIGKLEEAKPVPDDRHEALSILEAMQEALRKIASDESTPFACAIARDALTKAATAPWGQE